MNKSVDTYVELKSGEEDLLRVHVSGAKTELTLQGVSLLGSFSRGDGKQGITHPCTPVFGPDRKKKYGLKQHGNMRNEMCDVKLVADSIMVTHKITDEGYPQGVLVKQIMSIDEDGFSFVMIHHNTGQTQAAVNAGEHCYFDAPEGYKGTKVNGKDITELIENNWDGIAIKLKDTNSIQIPGKPEIELKQNGFNYVMLWVGKNPDSKEIDKTYVCIEPVESDPTSNFFGSPESMLLPGQSKSVMFSLLIKR